MAFHQIKFSLAISVLLFTCCLSTFADNQLAISDKISFENDIRPIFEAHCLKCHGPEKQESNYRLDIRSVAMSSADFGTPTIVAGDRSQSSLFSYISDPDADTVMPPPNNSKPLTKDQIETIGRWIDQGAIWPDELAGEENIKLKTDHWSFQPIRSPAIPDVSPELRNKVKNPIDNFVLESLMQKQLMPSEPADRVKWIRRVYLNMLGLLPTIKQVHSFVDDPSPDAHAKVIDSVLASPHYGERWARHWLDIVRYAESTGFEVNRERENAFYFRDYVIRSLNEDKSYKEFVIEQIAGDAVGVDVGNGFLVAGPYDVVKSPDINLTLMQREDELADIVNTTSTAFLGLTVACARCHNHKFDPILQRDYYAMQAVFAGVQHDKREFFLDEDKDRQAKLKKVLAESKRLQSLMVTLRKAHPYKQQDPPDTNSPSSMVNAVKNTDTFDSVKAKFVRFTVQQTNISEPCIDELEIFSAETNRNIALATAGAKATSSGNYPPHPSHKLENVNDGKYGNSNSWVSNADGQGWVQIELATPSEINRVEWGRDRQKQFKDRLATEYKIEVSLNGSDWTMVSNSARRSPFTGNGNEREDTFINRLPRQQALEVRAQYNRLVELRNQILLTQHVRMAYLGTFTKPKKIYRLHRGDPLAPREEVYPGAISVIGSLGLTSKTEEQQRRLALAHWIASDENPLTARVIVNRVWQFHFGRGIVATPSDFGKNGIAPTHPELLDWLATEFIKNDWSLKWLHRQILSSATYAQSSKPRPEAIAIDADDHFLWRYPPRRLEAEAIRDCVLQVSGNLNKKAGGKGFLLFDVDKSETVHHYFPLKEFSPDHFRRMIYMTKIRQEQDEVFGVFDCPDGGQVIPDRSRSTTPLQALNLLNSRFMLKQAEYLAGRLKQEAGEGINDQIKLAFNLMFLRQPVDEELQSSRQLIEEFGLEAFCRAILNANEFLFVS